MTLDELANVLLLCAGISYVILLVWFLVFTFAHKALYKLHARWFGLSTETFDAIHYAGMAVYKIGVLLLFIAPAIALWIVR